MLKRNANAKTRRILMPLKMYTLATLGSHHSRPGRNSPSNFVALCRKSSSISLWVPKSSYMRNLLKSYFIQSSNRYVLFLQRFDEECRLFGVTPLSLSPGRPRPIVWPIGLRPLTTADQSERSIRGTQAGCRSVD